MIDISSDKAVIFTLLNELLRQGFIKGDINYVITGSGTNQDYMGKICSTPIFPLRCTSFMCTPIIMLFMGL